MEKQLYSGIDDYVINEICEILKQNEIPFIKKADGSGSYMNISMGKSLQEKRIFVNESDYEKALSLIEIFTVDNKDNKKDEEELVNKSKTLIRGAGILIFAIPIIVIIVAIIMSLSNN